MDGRRSLQTILFLREVVPGVAAAEQRNQERCRVSVRRRDFWRIHNHMRGTVHSVLDGRAEEQQENGKSTTICPRISITTGADQLYVYYINNKNIPQHNN